MLPEATAELSRPAALFSGVRPNFMCRHDINSDGIAANIAVFFPQVSHIRQIPFRTLLRERKVR